MWSDKSNFEESGAEGQNRTVDTGIFSAVLYQLSYLGRQHSSKFYLRETVKNVGVDAGPFGRLKPRD